MIDRFIAEQSASTGQDVDEVREVTGRLLAMAEAAQGADAMGAVLDRLEGARAVMRSASSGSYMMSEVGGGLGGAMTGRFGELAGPAWIARELHLPEATVDAIAAALVAFVAETAGPAAGQLVHEGIDPQPIDEDEDADGEGRDTV